jgi:hypothetical protein
MSTSPVHSEPESGSVPLQEALMIFIWFSSSTICAFEFFFLGTQQEMNTR